MNKNTLYNEITDSGFQNPCLVATTTLIIVVILFDRYFSYAEFYDK